MQCADTDCSANAKSQILKSFRASDKLSSLPPSALISIYSFVECQSHLLVHGRLTSNAPTVPDATANGETSTTAINSVERADFLYLLLFFNFFYPVTRRNDRHANRKSMYSGKKSGASESFLFLFFHFIFVHFHIECRQLATMGKKARNSTSAWMKASESTMRRTGAIRSLADDRKLPDSHDRGGVKSFFRQPNK